MHILKCLAVDDEYLALNIIKEYVAKVPFLELVDTSKSALGALEILAAKEIDLIFLDIQMPDLSGLDFLKTLNNPPMVILTTAYQEYALSSYENDVVDYLLKPIRLERFLKAVNKARQLHELKNPLQQQAAAHPATMPPALASTIETPKDYTFLKSGYKSEKVFFKDIIYIEGQKEYITIHTKNKKYTIIQSLNSYNNSLPAGEFIRIHKSYIVSISKIEAIYGNTVELNGISLPIGRTYKEGVQKILGSGA